MEWCRHTDRHKPFLSLTHTNIYIQYSIYIYMNVYTQPSYVNYHAEKSPKNVAFSTLCALLCCWCLHLRLPLWVSDACIRTLACICLSACISPSVSQKQHITQLSLHPKEGPFHSRMLLAELRRIFLTVSLTLCWQTENHPHIPKRCRE